MFTFLVILTSALAQYENETVGEYINKQTALADFLLKNYKQELPPIYLRGRYDNVTMSKVNNVTMVFTYGKVLELNEPEQYISLIVESYIGWMDFRLQWDPRNWSGIQILQLSRTSLWVPDFMPVDLIDYNEFGLSAVQNVIVASNGSCTLAISAVIKLLCPLNIKEFPFDSQKCSIKIGSVNYLTTEIQISSSLAHTLDVTQLGNGAWKSENVYMFYESFKNPINGWEYPRVGFSMIMKRSSIYYVVLIILPSLILTSLTVLAMFWTEVNEHSYIRKLSLGFSAFLSQTMLLQITTQNMPKTSNLPALSVFILWNLIVLTSSIIAVLITAKYLRYRNLRPHKDTTFDLDIESISIGFRNRWRLLWRRSLERSHSIYKMFFLLVIAINTAYLLI